MQLREFAEQVLFAGSLDVKLASPGPVTDDRPAPVIETPSSPGRPVSLQFFKGRSKFEFPGTPRLENESARGQLLHFFANHELLAAELMALALLRFPNAPKAFRRGLLRTLQEEQAHTRLYIQRMRELGVEFGQYPVTGFIWNAVSAMATPLDYVSHLSLTFEQANLDYSKWYAEQFQIIGDGHTQRLFERIYRDEIRHVGYGLKWFRKWKDPSVTDWRAFESRLKLPLSPNRAKGVIFNVDGRAKAGFDASFIEELFVYSKSKGRTPGIFLFNPFAEHFIRQGPSFTPKKEQETMSRDLANLPQFLSRKDDVVIVPAKPDSHFLANLKMAGFELPEFQELTDGRISTESDLRTRKIDSFRPWAWSPDAISLLEPLTPNLNQTPMPTGKEWETQIRPLFSKDWSVSRLREFVSTVRNPHWFCPQHHIGVVVTGTSEALRTIQSLRKAGHARLVAKGLLGMAGANMRRLWEPSVTQAQQTWIRKTLAADGTLILEPWLDRVLDFSIQFEMSARGLRLVGFSKMLNDHRGQYEGSQFASNFTVGVEREVAAFLSGPRGNRLHKVAEDLSSFLGALLSAARFRGPLGIDAFVYRDERRELRLKPIVEINPRYTMGRLIIELMRNTSPGQAGMLRLINQSHLRRFGFSSFHAYAEDLRSRFPVEIKGQPKPRLSAGAVCLNDPTTARSCLAVFQVGPPQNDRGKSGP